MLLHDGSIIVGFTCTGRVASVDEQDAESTEQRQQRLQVVREWQR